MKVFFDDVAEDSSSKIADYYNWAQITMEKEGCLDVLFFLLFLGAARQEAPF